MKIVEMFPIFICIKKKKETEHMIDTRTVW